MSYALDRRGSTGRFHSLFYFFVPLILERWKRLIGAEEKILAGLAFDASRQNSAMAKLAMEIRGLRVPLIEPQPPPVSKHKRLYQNWSSPSVTLVRHISHPGGVRVPCLS